MNLLTTGEMAKRLNTDRDKVSYAVRKLNLQEIGTVGQTRAFSPSTLSAVKNFLLKLSRKKTNA